MAVVLLSFTFVSCDLLQQLLGGDDDLNENQELIQDLLGALDKAMMEVQTYSMNNSGAFPPGFTVSDSGNVRTKTFTNYTNADGVVLNGTDAMTFDNGVPPAPGTQQVAGDMAITFSGSIAGGPYAFTLKMTRTPPNPPVYTECTINSEDVLEDYQSMQP